MQTVRIRYRIEIDESDGGARRFWDMGARSTSSKQHPHERSITCICSSSLICSHVDVRSLFLGGISRPPHPVSSV